MSLMKKIKEFIDANYFFLLCLLTLIVIIAAGVDIAYCKKVEFDCARLLRHEFTGDKALWGEHGEKLFKLNITGME